MILQYTIKVDLCACLTFQSVLDLKVIYYSYGFVSSITGSASDKLTIPNDPP